MELARLRAHAHKRFAWLLALVLWLPAAQTFAALHVLSHAQTAQTAQTAQADTADVTHLVGQKVCDACLAAMAIAGGVPPVESFNYLQIAGPDTAPRVEWVQAFFAVPAQVYESRAPPLTPT